MNGLWFAMLLCQEPKVAHILGKSRRPRLARIGAA
jgi:hypothetical protein